MRQQVVLNIFNIPTKVEITYSTKTSHTFHYCFGMINVRVAQKYSINRIQSDLEKAFKIDVIKSFNPEPFMTEEYAYVLGEITKIYKTPNKELDVSNCKILTSYGKLISLKKYLQIILQERVEYYEKLMNINVKHKVNVKKLSSVLGNNHYKDHILNFNEKLIHFSLELIDSVVIHELCHDFYQNHSSLFYNKVEQYCPNYDKLRRKLIFGERK